MAEGMAVPHVRKPGQGLGNRTAASVAADDSQQLRYKATRTSPGLVQRMPVRSFGASEWRVDRTGEDCNA
jgi:hypothetical protein